MTDKVRVRGLGMVLRAMLSGDRKKFDLAMQRANEPTMTVAQVEDAIVKLRADAKRGIVTSVQWATYDPDEDETDG
jgi:hypothetical protein